VPFAAALPARVPTKLLKSCYNNEAANGRKAMEWFSRKTSIAGVQIPNWILVVAAVVVIWIIYTFTR